MVNDISEFSIRGDIADIFSLDGNPVRIELWGDEVVDIRYFNNETQKSIEKTKSVEILPIYKFTLDGKNNYYKIYKKKSLKIMPILYLMNHILKELKFIKTTLIRI